MFINNNDEDETVRQTLERIMREKGLHKEQQVLHTEIGDFGYYPNSSNNSTLAENMASNASLGNSNADNNTNNSLNTAQSGYEAAVAAGSWLTPTTQEATQSAPFTQSQSSVSQAVSSYAPSATAQSSEPDFLYKNNELSNKQWMDGTIPDFSGYSTSPLNMGLTAQPGQAHLKGLDTSLIQNREIIDSPYSNNILENDCYQSQRFEPFARRIRLNEGENQGVIYATPETTGTDQPTKYGITQDTLDLYRKNKEVADSYPSEVKDLTEDQAMNLLCQYYKGSRAEAINDPNLAFSVYDSYFNHPNNASIAWQQTLKRKINPDIQVGGGIGSQTVNGFNSITNNTKLLDTFIDYRQKTLEDEYKKGLINRFRRYPIK